MAPTSNAQAARKVAVIGIPMDLGSGRRGVDMGPSAVRIAGLAAKLRTIGFDVEDMGDVPIPVPETRPIGRENLRFGAEIATACKALKARVRDALARGMTPLVLGGDHSVAIGSVAGVSEHYAAKSGKVGLLWLDAHGDINSPESTPSGNIHGMPAAVCLGRGAEELLSVCERRPMVAVEKAAHVGIRELDPGEKSYAREAGLRIFTMREVDERGLQPCMREALDVVTRGTVGFHLTLDMDFVDPDYAPGVGTPVRGGATYREAHLALEMAADTGKVLSVEVTEVNPILDRFNETATLAVDLILSAFGKNIL